LLEGVEAEDRVLRYIRTSYENWKTPVKAKWAQGRPTCCKLFLLQLCNRSHPKAQSDSFSSLSLSLSLFVKTVGGLGLVNGSSTRASGLTGDSL
jgi:hypothetical protein